MRQYAEIKNQHKDAILLFRLGDFYEMFFDDAQLASKILDIALTSRDKNAQNAVPLCGVPYHSVASYISKLLEQGHKVAICEQVEDPKTAKGIVKREVVRVISPGLRTDLEGLAATETNALISLYAGKKGVGLAWIDVSTGDFRVTEFVSIDQAQEEIWRLGPREIVCPEESVVSPVKTWRESCAALSSSIRFELLPTWIYEFAHRKLCERFRVASLEGLGLSQESAGVEAAIGLLHYIENVSRTALPHLTWPVPYSVDRFVHLDHSTRVHLELERSISEAGRERTLLGCLDETETSMGSRKLKEWLGFPLRDLTQINRRLDSVEELSADGEFRESLRGHLRQVYDLERLVGRIASNRANARDLSSLRTTLEEVGSIRQLLEKCKTPNLQEVLSRLHPHSELIDTLKLAIQDVPPMGTREGGMIREGYNGELDELRELMNGGRQWIAQLETQERNRTGIGSLKAGYNRVFGYYIEVTHTHRDRIPAEYIRKQTLTNAERFVTPELKEQEAKILNANEKVSALEYQLFEELRLKVVDNTRSLQQLAQALSELDVYCALARVASRYRYCKPKVTDGDSIRIVAGRHPVVERFVGPEGFVPNDIELNCGERQMIILTGPNMAGKSTIMRQVALITLMAQIGSFVPADDAEIGIVDRIFTRVGASDDVSRGRSTFMVEMSEAANILRNATRNSLILLDEIGRGTSTFDGLAIAWAVAEDLHDRIGAKTVFATHYHELTDLPRTKDRVRNMNVAVKEWGEQIVFLRTMMEGAVNRSYGIEVARLAGVPNEVIERARQILANLEKGELDALGRPVLAGEKSPTTTSQLQLFHPLGNEVLTELDSLDLDAFSPKSALNLLYTWKERFRKS